MDSRIDYCPICNEEVEVYLVQEDAGESWRCEVCGEEVAFIADEDWVE